MVSDDFKKFLDRTTRVVERAMGEYVDVFDYKGKNSILKTKCLKKKVNWNKVLRKAPVTWSWIMPTNQSIVKYYYFFWHQKTVVMPLIIGIKCTYTPNVFVACLGIYQERCESVYAFLNYLQALFMALRLISDKKWLQNDDSTEYTCIFKQCSDKVDALDCCVCYSYNGLQHL